MAKMLEGKVAIVTGGGRGLGRGHVLALAKEGAKVIVDDLGGALDGTGKATSPADDVVKEVKDFGGEAVACYESVADFQAAKRIIDCAISNFGQLNILVNNAGPLRDRMIFNMSEEDWDISINTHLKGCFNCTRHACAYWRVEHKAGRVRGGRIINILSDAGLYGSPGQANYSAAKGGIGGFTMAVAQAMERYEVTCNAVAPGGRTRMVLETPSLAPLAKEPPPGEFDMMDPENVGPIVAFLASDEAKDITGEVFRLIGDRVWLLRGWHTIDTVAKGKAKWTPEELVPVVKGMMKKAPPKTSIMDIFKEAGMI